MSDNKRVACLYRVSTKMQVNTDDDIPVQRNACQNFINKHPDWEFTCEYLEKGVSGFKKSAEDRDVLQDIKRDAQKKRFDILLVFMFDRLGRREDETPFVMHWFSQQGIELWSVNEGQQRFDSHVDNLINYIRFWQANGESLKTSVRVDEAMRQMTKAGLYSGGRAPYGYKLVETGEISKKGKLVKKLVIDEETAPLVRMMFELSVSHGYGTHRVAKYLNENGYTALKGGQWNHCSVSYIMRNPTYKGYMPYGRTTGKGQEKQRRTKPEEWLLADERNDEIAIVSEVLWNRVQINKATIAARQEEQKQINLTLPDVKLGRSKLLFIGFIKCGCCGAAMNTGYKSYKWTTEDGVHHRRRDPVYRCSGQTSGKVGCTVKAAFKPEQIEGVVLEEVYKYLDTLKTVELSGEISRLQKQNTASEEKIIRELRKEKADTQKELESLKQEVVKAIAGKSSFDPAMLNGLLAEKGAVIARLEESLAAALLLLEHKKLEQRDLIELQTMIPVWREEFDKAAMDVKKVLLSKIIKEIVVHNDRVEIKLNMQIENFLAIAGNGGGEAQNGAPNGVKSRPH